MSATVSGSKSGTTPSPAQGKAAWGAVISMTLGVFGLVTAEFLPISLLTPIARDLQITEGLAGQAVSATALVALFSSLLVATATRNFDRRHVIIAFTLLLVGSNFVVASAGNFTMLLLGRVLLGFALGGFWAMSASIIMRLVPENMIPRALSILFSGVSAATVVAAPVGSYLGGIISWRSVFMVAAALSVIALVTQIATLPKMAPRGRASLRILVDLLRRPGMKFGLGTLVLIITGHFALFTYVRPFLENVTGVATTGVSAVLLGFGVANFFGNYLAGPLINRSLRITLIMAPLVAGACALIMVGLHGALHPTIVLVALWGMVFGAVPVGWSAWITRTVPDEAESGGGLFIASFQLAITAGAVIGGIVHDAVGALGVFGMAGTALLVAAFILIVGLRPNLAASDMATEQA